MYEISRRTCGVSVALPDQAIARFDVNIGVLLSRVMVWWRVRGVGRCEEIYGQMSSMESLGRGRAVGRCLRQYWACGRCGGLRKNEFRASSA